MILNLHTHVTHVKLLGMGFGGLSVLEEDLVDRTRVCFQIYLELLLLPPDFPLDDSDCLPLELADAVNPELELALAAELDLLPEVA